MSVVTPKLRETARDLGDEGTRWLEHLPARVEALAEAWSLTVGPAFDSEGCIAWVAPARVADGTEAVLKMGLPFAETRYEVEALRLYDGQGAARLLRVSDDGYSLLLERCLPGTNLWLLGEEEGNRVGAALLRRLWLQPPFAAPFTSLRERVETWCEGVPAKRVHPRQGPAAGFEIEIVDQAMETARSLAASQPASVLLHGDFHPGNVLAAEREPWISIDPQPVVGDPAFDLAQWLGNRCWPARQSPDPAAAVRRQAEQMSALLGLDPALLPTMPKDHDRSLATRYCLATSLARQGREGVTRRG